MPLWLRSVIATVILPGTAAVLVPWWIVSDPPRLPIAIGETRVLGILPLAAGVLIYLATTYQFAAYGRGTPAPWDAPRRLVRSGLHAWVRNPMYIGVLLVIVGEAIIWQSGDLLVYAALLWTAFHVRVLLFEEPTLRRTFGSDFDAYVATVPRWFPRRRRTVVT
jgi:protein-S-isoprenylcysteine O-methyltransferase Ste14